MTKLPSAKYKEIQNQWLNDIKIGKYSECKLIHKEVDLAQELNVSRPTIRHAIQNLVNAGYLERRKKRGTIVKHTKIKQQFIHVIESYNDEIKNNGLNAKTKVLSFKIEEAKKSIQKALNLKEQEKVYKLIRLRYANNIPVVLVTTYLPIKQLPNFAKIDFSEKSLYQELEKAGLAITQVKRKLEIKKANQDESKLLQIAENSPVFYFHSTGLTKDEEKLEYSIATYRGDNNYFMIDIDESKRI